MAASVPFRAKSAAARPLVSSRGLQLREHSPQATDKALPGSRPKARSLVQVTQVSGKPGEPPQAQQGRGPVLGVEAGMPPGPVLGMMAAGADRHGEKGVEVTARQSRSRVVQFLGHRAAKDAVHSPGHDSKTQSSGSAEKRPASNTSTSLAGSSPAMGAILLALRSYSAPSASPRATRPCCWAIRPALFALR